jgi:hypothetical protein
MRKSFLRTHTCGVCRGGQIIDAPINVATDGLQSPAPIALLLLLAEWQATTMGPQAELKEHTGPMPAPALQMEAEGGAGTGTHTRKEAVSWSQAHRSM